MKTLRLDGSSLTIEDVYLASTSPMKIAIAPSSIQAMKKSRRLVEEWLERKESIYGVTTGFGEFSNVHIPIDKIEELQENLIMSHAAGAGTMLPPDIVRGMMILRINALAKGFSGIRPSTVEFIVKFFNAGLVPVVPAQGSVGSSGDLVQLAHMTLAFLGRGSVMEGSLLHIKPAEDALKRVGLKPIRLSAKEGLALINGTQMMTSFASLIIHEAELLAKLADITAALSVEALRGTDRAFDPKIHNVRPYPGQMASASNLRRLVAGSQIRESHRINDTRVQDAYSLRCAPQVHGASRDALGYVKQIVSVEINSANDNPLIFPDEREHLEGGNFHGQPIALAMDFAAIALSELANISERRIERMVNGSLSGLPRFLTKNGGLNSGLMIAQYTAASLVSENKVLAHPASVDSIPTSANQEDHNSMGSIAAQKCRRVLRNAQTVIAIELLTAAQAIDFHKPLRAGKGTEAAYKTVRKAISFITHDVLLYDEIQKSVALVRSNTVLKAVERAIGALE
ncbi:MAG TPA: histidine ammonia-lyase [Bacteroidota bacterium]|nr:histidine ammonia-lyase [Bacteroidota bacterium]